MEDHDEGKDGHGGDGCSEETIFLPLTEGGLEQLHDFETQLAKRIVEFRERYGAFKSVEALSDVRGIGTVLLEKNEQRIELE